MLNTFRAYDPATLLQKSHSTACEACYSRKVRCEPSEYGGRCKQCDNHRIECRPRTRKRKTPSVEHDQKAADDTPPRSRSPAGSQQRRDESFVGSSRPVKRSITAQSSPDPSAKYVRGENSVSVPDLFVHRETSTAISPESPDSLEPPSKFRNASYMSRSAILGDDFPDIDHAHTDLPTRPDRISPFEVKILKMRGAFDLPELPLRQSLIEAYIAQCHPWNPVVDLDSITGPVTTADGSLLLLQAVLLVGSLMRPDACGKGFSDRQYQRVKSLVHSGYEQNPLNILAALCLVQWYTPAAPKDISMDIPRSWNTFAIELSLQMGLQRASNKEPASQGRRKRIWWTLVVRDLLTSSAHGRPRIIQPEDCTIERPNVGDFDHPNDPHASLFIHYVGVVCVLGDLCVLMNRNGEVSTSDRFKICSRLQQNVCSLPSSLGLYTPEDVPMPYNFEAAQLNIPILTTMAILFRPKTVFQLTSANTASVTAAFLSYRIFQAVQFREQTRFLSSAFSWHLLVTAIPLLSCTKVVGLSKEANEALDTLETVLETLGKVKPSAANNLRSVQTIRKAMVSKTAAGPSSNNAVAVAAAAAAAAAAATTADEEADRGSERVARDIFRSYGADALRQHDQIFEVLGAHHNSQADRSAHAAAHTLSSLCGRPTSVLEYGHLTPDNDTQNYVSAYEVDVQHAVTALFEDDMLNNNSWMMKNWMDDLQFGGETPRF